MIIKNVIFFRYTTPMPKTSNTSIKASSEALQWLSIPKGAREYRCTVAPGIRTVLGVRIDGSSDALSLTLDVGAESTVFFLVMVEGNKKSLSLRQESHLANGARVHFCNIARGDKIDWSLVSNVEGSDAMSTVDWAFCARRNEAQKISARNIFAGRNGGGEITMKGVAEGKAHVTCHGMIEIAEGGTGTDTYLTEDVLMLDATAKIDAVPGLEIRTNDVKASHSATVSRVTVEDLFYFQSRGIDPKTARQMYVDGFLGSIVDRIESDEVKTVVRASLIHG